MKHFVEAVLVVGPLNQNYEGVTAIKQHEHCQYQGQQPSEFCLDRLLAFEIQADAFSK
jgi:hypothetical protein